MSVAAFLLSLIVIFGAAKIFGEIAERIGQPAVLGEMAGGIAVGVSGLHLVDPHAPVLHLLSELGVVLLLFLIGLGTDINRLIAAGPAAGAVAVTGVVLPFAFGFGVARLLGVAVPVAIFLGAAVIDDILGLILLTVAGAIAAGEAVTLFGTAKVIVIAIGFVVVAIAAGSMLAPFLIRLVAKLRVSKALFFGALMFALTLAWCAQAAGSALIIGAFAAGLVLARTEKGADIEHETHDIAQFFVPIFFVLVGAAVDLRQLNPFDPAARKYLVIGMLLTLVGIGGKLIAGYAAPRRFRRIVIGVGMIPRGEVGLIFAQIGITAGLLSAGLYSSVALMVMLTTFITPPLLRLLLPGGRTKNEVSTLQSVVTESLSDAEPRS